MFSAAFAAQRLAQGLPKLVVPVQRDVTLALVEIGLSRCAPVKFIVKAMKKGTAPIGLTIAGRALSGLSRSMPSC